MKQTIQITPTQAEWCKRNLDFDPYKDKHYKIEVEGLPLVVPMIKEEE